MLDLIKKIKSVDAKDLENERYNNLSKKEKELLKWKKNKVDSAKENPK